MVAVIDFDRGVDAAGGDKMALLLDDGEAQLIGRAENSRGRLQLMSVSVDFVSQTREIVQRGLGHHGDTIPFRSPSGFGGVNFSTCRTSLSRRGPGYR